MTERAGHGGTTGAVRLTVARSFRELAEIRRFRSRTFRQRSGLVLDDELALDRRSIGLGLRQRGELVACARVVPLPDADAGISAFEHPALQRCTAATEVGRLAVAPGRSPLLLAALLGLGSEWMLENTPYRDYVAYCNAKLVPAYEAVGARDLGLDVARPGSERRYRVVAGRFDSAAAGALGLLAALRGRDRLLRSA